MFLYNSTKLLSCWTSKLICRIIQNTDLQNYADLQIFWVSPYSLA